MTFGDTLAAGSQAQNRTAETRATQEARRAHGWLVDGPEGREAQLRPQAGAQGLWAVIH